LHGARRRRGGALRHHFDQFERIGLPKEVRMGCIRRSDLNRLERKAQRDRFGPAPPSRAFVARAAPWRDAMSPDSRPTSAGRRLDSRRLDGDRWPASCSRAGFGRSEYLAL
jgi:hypothetical protein